MKSSHLGVGEFDTKLKAASDWACGKFGLESDWLAVVRQGYRALCLRRRATALEAGEATESRNASLTHSASAVQTESEEVMHEGRFSERDDHVHALIGADTLLNHDKLRDCEVIQKAAWARIQA